MENYPAADWSPIDMLQRAWERALPYLIVLVGATFGVFVVQFGVGLVFGLIQGIIVGIAAAVAQERGGQDAELAAQVIRILLDIGKSIITFPLTMFTTGALARLALSVARGEPADLGAFSQAFSKIGSLMFAGLLTGLAVALGLCFCIIPGIIVGIGLQFVVFVVMDTELGAIGSLQYAWAVAKDHLLNLFVFGLLVSLIALVALCGTCGIGLLVFQPVAAVAQALIYVHVSGRTQDFLPDPVV